jgi:hypothetical protein
MQDNSARGRVPRPGGLRRWQRKRRQFDADTPDFAATTATTATDAFPGEDLL